MKKTLLLLAAGCLVLPAFSHADSGGTEIGKKRTGKVAVPAHGFAQPANSRKVICYITSTARTGSAIPMVYRQYNGRIDTASNAAVYGQSSIETSGALDVGASLYRLDPSFISRR